MRIVATFLLFWITLSAEGSIGIIDRTEAHFKDMAKVAGHVKVIGILVETHEDIANAIQAFIILEVDVIAMPIQMWRYDSRIARMVAVANHRGIWVIGAGSNKNGLIERIKKQFGCRLQKYIGIEYVNSSFLKSASENCVTGALSILVKIDR